MLTYRPFFPYEGEFSIYVLSKYQGVGERTEPNSKMTAHNDPICLSAGQTNWNITEVSDKIFICWEFYFPLCLGLAAVSGPYYGPQGAVDRIYWRILGLAGGQGDISF